MANKFDLTALGSMEQLLGGLETDDPIGSVLRLHLQAERLIEIFLKGTITPDMAEVFNVPQQFNHKVAIATALGLPKEISLAAQELNSLRNKIAHRAGKIIEAGDVDKLLAKAESFRVALFPKEAPIADCSIRVHVLGGEKIKYGTKGPNWDFKIVVGMLVGMIFRFLVGSQATAESPEA